MASEVKSTRRYDSSGRRAQAERNREAILVAARRQFLARGYAETTIAAIAREAGVSVETIYKAFGAKAGLVSAIYERGLEGLAQTRAFDRSDAMRERETDPRAIMREWGRLSAEVGSQVVPIALLIRAAAAGDPEIAALLDDNEAMRLRRARHHARFLAGRGYLREGVSVSHATDVLWTCSSSELYELLVLRRSWSRRRFARFLGDYMVAALLPGGARSG